MIPRRRHHRTRLAAAAALLATAAAVGAMATTSGALAGAPVQAGAPGLDPAGDVKGGAGPDLTAIDISHTATTVTFRVRFAKAPPLRTSTEEQWTDMLLIAIDVPPRSLRRTAHGWLGSDFYLGMHGAEPVAVLVRAPKSPSEQGRMLGRQPAAVSGRTISITVNRRRLGDPDWVEVAVAAGREASSPTAGGGSDEAPARDAFHHQLRG